MEYINYAFHLIFIILFIIFYAFKLLSVFVRLAKIQFAIFNNNSKIDCHAHTKSGQTPARTLCVPTAMTDFINIAKIFLQAE